MICSAAAGHSELVGARPVSVPNCSADDRADGGVDGQDCQSAADFRPVEVDSSAESADAGGGPWGELGVSSGTA
jgi:hypothetical protein